MQKNLTVKTVVIVATILICVFGIIGFPKSGAELQANIRKNISLGLDLRGGSQLELQVKVQDAIKGVAQQVVDSLQEERRKGNVDFSTVDRNDPKTIAEADSIQVNIHGVNASKMEAFKNFVKEHYTQWKLENVSGPDYKMTMTPSDLIETKRNTVAQSIDTIKNRVDALGVAESVVRQDSRADSDFEILVQLPGVDDPERVKDIIGQAAQLSVVEVKEGPFQSEQAAHAGQGRHSSAEYGAVELSARCGTGCWWHMVSGFAFARSDRAGPAQCASVTG